MNVKTQGSAEQDQTHEHSIPGMRTVCLNLQRLFCRRKARESKAYAKQVQAEKQKERNAAKKKQIESVTNMRKQREKSVSRWVEVLTCGRGGIWVQKEKNINIVGCS